MAGFGCLHPRVHSQTSPGCLPHSRQPCSSIARCFHIRHQHSSRQSRPYRTCVRSLRAQNNERQGGGLDPSLEIAVPSDQRPVNELAALRNAPLYSWVSSGRGNTVLQPCGTAPLRGKAYCQLLNVQATLEQSAYVKRLGIVWLLFFALLGGPIAYQTFDPLREVSRPACGLLQARMSAQHPDLVLQSPCSSVLAICSSSQSSCLPVGTLPIDFIIWAVFAAMQQKHVASSSPFKPG